MIPRCDLGLLVHLDSALQLDTSSKSVFFCKTARKMETFPEKSGCAEHVPWGCESAAYWPLRCSVAQTENFLGGHPK